MLYSLNKVGILTRNTVRYLTTVPSHVNTSSVLSSDCKDFIEIVHQKLKEQHQDCLKLRKSVQKHKQYGFRKDTQHITSGDWKVSSLYEEHPKLVNRHVEITGPANNKRMVINAMNSDANGYMTDLEDSMTPSWENVIAGHENISHAVRGDLTDTKYDANGKVVKEYSINPENIPTFFVRSRGLHMMENNVLDTTGNPISATIFDIATHLYNNGEHLHNTNTGPYLYTPKLESYEDALFVNNVIAESENLLGLPNGTSKTTVLIETYPAIYQTDEIVYALRDRIAGLNCGRWDYLFSMIKCLGSDVIFPDRDILTMDQPFLSAYVKQIVSTCHKRGIHAMGGMSAFIPSGDEQIWNTRLSNIKKDKEMEISRGCDGAWVAHPGLIKDIQSVFSEQLGRDNQIENIPNKEATNESDFTELGEDSKKYSYGVFQNNINISLQYIAAWLSGNGAVALNGLMEDLATAEISVHQIKQWYDNKIFRVNEYDMQNEIKLQVERLQKNNEIPYAMRFMDQAENILTEYVLGNYNFLYDVASKHLQYKDGFKSIKFEDDVLHKLGGSKPNLTGVELTKYRGEFLNNHLYVENHSAYKFLGTSNGVSAVNVVAGGNGFVGPYAGGWQTNAMKNRLGMLLPDTLHVSPEEAANCAEEINNHLQRADEVQHIQQLSDPENFEGNIKYHDIALLADMEQGWNTPEKTRISVKKAIQNGINVIHIEDQGEKKRCGHLGDKELNTYDDYALILRSANLAAQELLGSEQAEKQWVRFVARTDAYSAKRIVNSHNLYDPENDEYKFVDWDRGQTPDGKYLYLKQGVNPKTGNTWGLDLSIERCAKVVDQGLASHVWMETPDADLQVAKDFITGVNEILVPKGKKAYGLYNHSPSFDWDVKFFAEAKPLAHKIADYIRDTLSDGKLYDSHGHNSRYNNDNYLQSLRSFINEHGVSVNGDDNFTDENLEQIHINGVDYYHGEQRWEDETKNLLNNSESSNNMYNVKKYAKHVKETGFAPVENITEIIVDQRLTNFSKQLSSFGFNLHLITLPEFHVTAFNMHKLSQEFIDSGINAFVKNTQRPERITSENDPTYTYYKHQTATGTGVEAAFSVAVGSSNVNILSDSTEADDIKRRG